MIDSESKIANKSSRIHARKKECRVLLTFIDVFVGTRIHSCCGLLVHLIKCINISNRTEVQNLYGTSFKKHPSIVCMDRNSFYRVSLLRFTGNWHYHSVEVY